MDLASLTKVIGPTTAIMQLTERGTVDVNRARAALSPDWVGPNKTLVTVRHPATHTSGLPAFKPYDTLTHNPDSLAALLYRDPLDTLPGVRMVYSDIGALSPRESSSNT